MGQLSAIEWTEATWNPWHGCRQISPGCAHCYMYREKRQYGQDPTRIVRSKTTFDAPLKWKDSRMIFTCSWSDFFIEEADRWREEAWEVIRSTPHHTYQILTKRPERMAGNLPAGWPWENVWLGVSVENPRFYWRIFDLERVPAAIRFVSLEPLLAATPDLPLERISWVIVGGESGPGCRPMRPEWVRSVRQQCVAARVPFFFKQWGGARKELRGRTFEGRLWDEMPQAGGRVSSLATQATASKGQRRRLPVRSRQSAFSL
ncbi:MAG TPA: phage Gp37/Gp68 family protein [Terriglobia bacterium]|nr:phage Gp37/Gp68 family protein [Terriglobia bacterium]